MASEPTQAITDRCERAAYKALAALRLPAAIRRDIAARTVTALAEVPAEYLPMLVEMGPNAGLVHEITKTLPTVGIATQQRRTAAATAMVAAAQEMLKEAKNRG